MSLLFLDVENQDALVREWKKPEIKYYKIAIDVDGNSGDPDDAKRETVKFEHMEEYGWIGIYAQDFQDAENQLKNIIKERLGDDGQANCVILHSHGGYLPGTDNVGVYTNNNTGQRILASDMERLILSEKEKKEEEEKKKKRAEKREEIKRKREEERNKRKEDYEKMKGKQRREAEEKEQEILDQERKDDEDWEDKVKQHENLLKDKEDQLNKVLTVQVRKDIASLINMVNCVRDNQNFILCACRSAYSDRFLEALLTLTDKKVNLYGLTKFSKFTIIGRPGNNEGLFDAKKLLEGELLAKRSNSLLIEDPDNKVKKYSGVSAPKIYSDIRMVKNGIEFIE